MNPSNNGSTSALLANEHTYYRINELSEYDTSHSVNSVTGGCSGVVAPYCVRGNTEPATLAPQDAFSLETSDRDTIVTMVTEDAGGNQDTCTVDADEVQENEQKSLQIIRPELFQEVDTKDMMKMPIAMLLQVLSGCIFFSRTTLQI